MTNELKGTLIIVGVSMVLWSFIIAGVFRACDMVQDRVMPRAGEIQEP